MKPAARATAEGGTHANATTIPAISSMTILGSSCVPWNLAAAPAVQIEKAINNTVIEYDSLDYLDGIIHWKNNYELPTTVILKYEIFQV